MHAYLLLTNIDQVDVEKAIPGIEKPFVFHNFKQLKIDDIRNIRNLLLMSGKESHIIKFDTFTEEAQNAFLKILEEPTSQKTLILVTSSKNHLLDTVLSRILVINVSDTDFESKYSDFLDKDISERLSIVSEILKLDKEDIKKESRMLLSGILKNKNLSTKDRYSVAKMHDYLFDKGSSAKHVLEFVAVTL